MTNKCRTCGDEIEYGDYKNLFDVKDSHLLEEIYLVTKLWLEYKEGLPENICTYCLQDLSTAMAFRERCIYTQSQFEKEETIVTSTTYGRDHPDNIDTTHDNTDAEFYSDDSELIRDLYEVECQEDDDTAVKDETLVNIKLEIDDDMPEATYKPAATIIATNAATVKTKVANVVDKCEEELPKNAVLENLMHKTKQALINKNISWKNFTEEEARLLKKMKRKRNCICEQCGRHFNDAGNFKLHLLRHTGKKDYQCDICSAKFYTPHLLKRHTRLHSGIPLFNCQYCGRPFNNRRSVTDHERIHTDERPFTCNQCGKCFRSKRKCNDHMVVHTRTRNYHCTVCDKSFSLRKTLSAHYRSKTHKGNENSKQNVS